MFSFNAYGDCYGEYLLDTSDNFQKAIKVCTPSAESGDLRSQDILGFIFYKNENYKESLKWTKIAADKGFAPAQLRLGLMYETGKGVLIDYVTAVKWYRKSAEQGNVSAQNNMGLMYELGNGVLKNYKVSASWYKKAADAGSATAQMNLGIYYCYGSGVEKDLSKSKNLLNTAYESGQLSPGQKNFVEGIWERCELANY